MIKLFFGSLQSLVLSDHSFKKHLQLYLSPDKPSKPNDLTVPNVMKDSMVLTWQPPTHTGGSDITAYIIEKRDAKRNTWTQVEKVTGTTNTCSVQKLLEGNEYYFRVSAENDIGQGEPNELEAPIKAKCPYGK